MPARPRLLVCAFGPFPGVPVNPAQRAVADLLRLRRPALDGLDIHVELLATRWDALAGLGELLDRLAPDGVLLFGVAARRRIVCVEALAFNAARDAPDAARRHPPGRRLIKEGAGRSAATVSAGPLAAALRGTGVPAVASRDAGRYLCNASLFHAVAWARGQPGPPPPVVFIHLPGQSGRPAEVPREVMTRGLSALATAFAAHVRRVRMKRAPRQRTGAGACEAARNLS